MSEPGPSYNTFNTAEGFPDLEMHPYIGSKRKRTFEPPVLLHRERLCCVSAHFRSELLKRPSRAATGATGRAKLTEWLLQDEVGVHVTVLRHAYYPGEPLDLHTAVDLMAACKLAVRWQMPAAASQAFRQLAHEASPMGSEADMDAGTTEAVLAFLPAHASVAPAEDVAALARRVLRRVLALDGLGAVVAHMATAPLHGAACDVLCEASAERWDADTAAALLALPEGVALPHRVAANALGVLLAAAQAAVTDAQTLRVLGDAPAVLRTPELLACWKRLPEPAVRTLACSDRLGVDGEEDVVCLLAVCDSAYRWELLDSAVRVPELGSTYLAAVNHFCAASTCLMAERAAPAAKSELLARCGPLRKAMAPCTRRRLPHRPCVLSGRVTCLPTRSSEQVLAHQYFTGFDLELLVATTHDGRAMLWLSTEIKFPYAQRQVATVRAAFSVKGRVVHGSDAFVLSDEERRVAYYLGPFDVPPFDVSCCVELD
jgi:hypothetical protein